MCIWLCARLTPYGLSDGHHQSLLLSDGIVDLPNDDQPNKEAAFYLVGSALIIASIVLGLVWVFSQWWM